MRKRSLSLLSQTDRKSGISALFRLANWLFLSTLLPSQAAWTATHCQNAATQLKLETEISASGQEKLVRLGYSFERRTVDQDLAKIDPTPDPFGANRSNRKCQGNNLFTLTPKDAREQCFGILPVAVWPKESGNPRDNDSRGLEYFEPVQMRISALKVPHLALSKNPKIHCERNICDVTTDIEQFNLEMNLRASSVNERCDQVALRNVRLGLKPGKPVASAHMRFQFTGNLSEPIKVLWNDSEIKLPAGSIDYSAKASPPGINGVCGKAKDLESRIPEILRDLVVERPVMINLILEQIKKTALQETVAKIVREAAKTNGLSQERRINMPMPNLGRIVDETFMKKSVQYHQNTAADFAKQITAAKSTAEFDAASPRGSLDSLVQDFNDGFKSLNSSDVRGYRQSVAQAWTAAAAQVRAKMDSIPSGVTASPDQLRQRRILEGDLVEIQGALSALEAASKQAGSLPEPGPHQEVLDLMATGLRANELQGSLQASVSGCFACLNLPAQRPASSGDWSFENSPRHDLGFATHRNSINLFMAAMLEGKNWDLCVASGTDYKEHYKTCDAASSRDDVISLHFNQAPQIEWNSRGQPILKVKQIQLTNRNNAAAWFGREMRADVEIPLIVRPTADHKDIDVVPIGHEIQIHNPTFSNGELAGGRSTGDIAARMGGIFRDIGPVHSAIKDAVKFNVGLPMGATVSSVDTRKRDWIGLYVDLPSDPESQPLSTTLP